MNPPSSTPGSPGASGWTLARRLLLTTAVLATLIAIFYTEENWRGRSNWERCRKELESKGEVLDWAAYIPEPVPDEQNFFKAPEMQDWFIKHSLLDQLPSSGKAGQPQSPFALPRRKATDLLIAEITVTLHEPASGSGPGEAVLRFGDRATAQKAANLIQTAVGPCVEAATGGLIVQKSLDKLTPLHLTVESDKVLTTKELAALFPINLPPRAPGLSINPNYLQVAAAGTNAFHLLLKGPLYSAADYLQWTAPLISKFDLIRKALERPYAQIDCDYRQPFAIAIPNFISMRTVCQILSNRAQSYFLLGDPAAAGHELGLVHNLSGILLGAPSGKPMTLVSAMIYVAISGLYSGVVQDGLCLHAWQELQLESIQTQLERTDLLTPVVEALREERAATSQTFETIPRGELLNLFNFEAPASRLALRWMPRGWFFQNMAVGARLEQQMLGAVDLPSKTVSPRHLSEASDRHSLTISPRSPYTFLVAAAIPNFTKALQTAARNQDLVFQGQIACALERHHLTHGQYPETLQGLEPQTVRTLPRDVVGGKNFEYRRQAEGYVLYSFGWNEKDDGGVPDATKDDGDWVWQVR